MRLRTLVAAGLLIWWVRKRAAQPLTGPAALLMAPVYALGLLVLAGLGVLWFIRSMVEGRQ